MYFSILMILFHVFFLILMKHFHFYIKNTNIWNNFINKRMIWNIFIKLNNFRKIFINLTNEIDGLHSLYSKSGLQNKLPLYIHSNLMRCHEIPIIKLTNFDDVLCNSCWIGELRGNSISEKQFWVQCMLSMNFIITAYILFQSHENSNHLILCLNSVKRHSTTSQPFKIFYNIDRIR